MTAGPYRAAGGPGDDIFHARQDWSGHFARTLPLFLAAWLCLLAIDSGRVLRFGLVVLAAPSALVIATVAWMVWKWRRTPVALEARGRHLLVWYGDGQRRTVHVDELAVRKVREGSWTLDPDGRIVIQPHLFWAGPMPLLDWFSVLAGREIRVKWSSTPRSTKPLMVTSVHRWELRRPECYLGREMSVAAAVGVTTFVGSARMIGLEYAVALGVTAMTGAWLFVWLRRPSRLEMSELGINIVRGMSVKHLRGRLVRARRENGRTTLETASGGRISVRDEEFPDVLEWARFSGTVEEWIRRDVVINPIARALKRHARTNEILDAVRTDMEETGKASLCR